MFPFDVNYLRADAVKKKKLAKSKANILPVNPKKRLMTISEREALANTEKAAKEAPVFLALKEDYESDASASGDSAGTSDEEPSGSEPEEEEMHVANDEDWEYFREQKKQEMRRLQPNSVILYLCADADQRRWESKCRIWLVHSIYVQFT